MSHRTPRKRLRLRAAVAAAALMTPGLAACSSGLESDEAKKDGGSDVPTAITRAVAEAEAPVDEWSGPTEAVQPPAGAKVTILSCGSVGIGCVLASDAAKEAAEKLGWDATVVDGKLDPSVWNSLARQAAADGQDALILVATSPALMSEGLAQVEKAGMPVVLVFQPHFDGAPELDGYVTVNHEEDGDLLGKYMIADSGGKANVLVLDSPEYPESVMRNEAVVASLEDNCGDCTVTRQDFSAATMAQRLAGQVTSLLQQNPDVDYVFVPYDAAGSFIAQGIRQAAKSSDVQFVSAEGDPSAFERIKNGEQAATMAGSQQYMGWLAVDTIARLLAGAPTEKTLYVPERLITEDNVGDIDGENGWKVEVDYQSEFLKLWGK
jgi:ribose transport system substrate-binding protein